MTLRRRARGFQTASNRDVGRDVKAPRPPSLLRSTAKFLSARGPCGEHRARADLAGAEPVNFSASIGRPAAQIDRDQ